MLAEALRTAVADVLEKMFFVRALDPEEFAASDSGAMLTAQLSFRGQPPGWLTLRIAAKPARAIAADFLGANEEELSDPEVGDVICELANMICGSVLSRLESTVAFRLDSPHLVQAGHANVDLGAGEHEIGISYGMMSVCLKTDRNECLPAAEYAS